MTLVDGPKPQMRDGAWHRVTLALVALFTQLPRLDMQATSHAMRHICSLFVLSLPLVASAATCVVATPSGSYAYERNLSILNTGPLTCAAVDITSYGTLLANSVQTSAGGTSQASNGYAGGVLASGSTSLGVNHASFIDSVGGGVGLTGHAYSLWTDVVTVTGPIGTAATLSFTGHLDGRLSRYDGGDSLPGATLYYELLIGTTVFTVRGNAASVSSQISRDDSLPTLVSSVSREPFAPGGDLAVAMPFQVNIPLYFYDATPLTFGMMGNLAVGGSGRDVADFGNTVALESIAIAAPDGSQLVSGFGINAHGVALQQDAQGRFLYAAAAVPEAPTGLLMLAGLGALGVALAKRCRQA